jgi:hypothetical protein
MSTKRKLTTWAGAVALAWAVAGLTAAHAQTTTHVYASPGPDAPENRNLQNAIDASGPGDTLILHGNFPGWDGAVVGAGRRTTIASKTNLTLIADATDGASVAGDWNSALYISGSSNITVAGIAFSLYCGNGIEIVNNCSGMQVVSNCTVTGNSNKQNGAKTGLYSESRVTIVGCHVNVTTNHTGINVAGQTTSANSLILNNTITNCSSGIGLTSTHSQAIGNTIANCIFWGIRAGNYTYNSTMILQSNTVHHCNIGLENGPWTPGTRFIANVVYSNTTYGINIDPGNTTFSEYFVHHNTVYGNGTGIRIANAGYVGYNQVAANIVVGNGTGIDLNGMSTVPAIVYSDIWNNTTDYANDAVGATKTGVVTSDPGFHSTDPANKRFLQLGPATPSAMLTTGDDSGYGGAAYMGAIAPYFPAGTTIVIK